MEVITKRAATIIVRFLIAAACVLLLAGFIVVIFGVVALCSYFAQIAAGVGPAI